MKKPKTLIIIPAYNEESTIKSVVDGAVGFANVCIIDDASKDQTPVILKKLVTKYKNKVFVITHKKNTHIPGGVQDGMKFALKNKYDFVITMDAGMSHDPNDLPLLLDSDPSFELVIGRRKVIEGSPFYRRLISWLAARVMNYCLSKSIFDVFGYGIRDCTSGFRRYSKSLYSKIASSNLESVAFDFHMEALYIALKNPVQWKEVDIKYVFSNSSFNKKVLKLAIQYSIKLLKKKFYILQDSK